ncbi:MAG: 30S ribosomal protein S4 [Candidatus Hodarchaeales archaeon]|jgi:small subunit ribosomal protein S4
MGDPRRLRKKLEGPRHPFNKARIEEEMLYMGKYGLRNKKEIWKPQTILRNYRARARASLALPEQQREKERLNLVKKLFHLGVMHNEDGLIDEVLSLSLDQFLKRRLQSIIHELGIAKSPWQARQMICHGHIAIQGRKVTSPSYFVARGEEESISYAPSSVYNDSTHPALTAPTSSSANFKRDSDQER